MQNIAFSEVSGGPYCNSNINSETETYAANLIFCWYPVTAWNNQELSASFVSM